MRLGTEMVNLIRLHLFDESTQSRTVGKIAVVEEETSIRLVGISIEMLNAIGVEC
jgi:hypothetical protein